MAFAAVGALIAGEAVTAAVALTAVAEIGAVMGVVGAVTGNKDLMKIGGVMGLVGGIGSMAVGAMSGAGAAGAAAEGSLATEGTGALLKGVDAAAGDAFSGASLGGDAAVAGLTSGVADPTASNMTNPTMNGQMPDMENPFSESSTVTSPGNPNPSAMKVGPMPEPTVNDVAGAKGPDGVSGPTSPADTYPDAQSIRNANNTDPSLINKNSAPQDSGSFFKSVSEFANKNPALFNSGMQLVGGAMNGANQREMWDQKMALGQQELNQRSYGSQVANAPRGILATGGR